MNDHLPDFAKKWFSADFETLTEREQRIIKHYGERRPVSHDTNQEFDTTLTFGQKLADKVAMFGGSWTFIVIFGAILLAWVLLNALLLARRGDTFVRTRIFCSIFLSMLASIRHRNPMSQNRQSIKDRLDAAHDYEVNLKAELEILSLHEKLDELRQKNWAELIVMQQEQIGLLTKLLKERGVAIKPKQASAA